MKKNSIGLFLLILLFAGCNSAKQSPQSADVIIPLAVGNEWHYNIEYYPPDGSIIGPYKDSMIIISKHTADGLERHELSTGEDIYYEGNALVSYKVNIGKYIWLRYPMQLNVHEIIDTSNWETEVSDGPIEDVQEILTYLGNDFSVNTPSGSYTTLKYELTSHGMSTGTDYMKEYSYYALNVGLVMKETYMIDSLTNIPYLTSRQRLTKVVLK